MKLTRRRTHGLLTAGGSAIGLGSYGWSRTSSGPPRPLAIPSLIEDTILINRNERVRLLLEFSDYADPVTPYMFHCHILEHEDAGMMGQFVVAS